MAFVNSKIILKETRPYLLMVYKKKKKEFKIVISYAVLPLKQIFVVIENFFYYENVKPILFHTRKMHGDLWVSS